MRTARRRNTLIAACALGLVIVVGLVAERRSAALRTPPAEDQAKLAATQPGIPEGTTNGWSAPPSTPEPIAVPAPGQDSTAAKPVVIDVVKPWIEIARMPEYVKANPAEREAIRDLFWRICVEEKIPLEQRTPAYEKYVRDWDIRESGASDAPRRTTSAELQREQQAAVSSPVSAETLRRWCRTDPAS